MCPPQWQQGTKMQNCFEQKDLGDLNLHTPDSSEAMAFLTKNLNTREVSGPKFYPSRRAAAKAALLAKVA